MPDEAVESALIVSITHFKDGLSPSYVKGKYNSAN